MLKTGRKLDYDRQFTDKPSISEKSENSSSGYYRNKRFNSIGMKQIARKLF